MTKDIKYSEKDITRLKGLDGCRKRPTMYLGERGNPMVFQMNKEIIDNCLDEYLAGRNKSIYIHVDNKSGVYTVADEADGIPVGLVPSDPENPKSKKVSVLTLIFTELHTGGKIGSKAYASSRGVHGVGASAVNAISTSFEVWTRREGKLYYQAFKDSKPVGVLEQVRSIPAVVQKSLNKKYTKGTIIRFVPDQKIVGVDNKRAILEMGYTARWLRFVAMLNPGLSVTLSDGQKSKTFINTKGISYLVDKRVTDEKLTPLGAPFIYQSPSLSCVLQWTDYADEDGVSSYVCSGLTRFGGEHENGMRSALFKALKEHTLAREKFTAKDLYIGLVGILDFRMSEAEYTGQTKEKLASKVAPQVEEELYTALKAFFAKKKSLARNIIKRAIAVTKSKEAFKETLKAAVNAKKSKGSALPGVLASCPRARPEEREIYLVEGDSASGTAKKARNPNFQEILAINGKIANAATAKPVKLLANSAIQNILLSIGYNFDAHKKQGDVEHKLRVGSIYLLPDADVDGGHIAVLILTLIHKFLPELFTERRVFLVDAPLFTAFYKGKRYFGNTLISVQKQLPSNAPKGIIMRSKGWGEIDFETLSEIAFNPKTRSVIEVQPIKGKELQYFERIVGAESTARKELLGI